MDTEETNVVNDLHSMATSMEAIKITLEQIAEKFCGIPTKLVVNHSEPKKESVPMAKKPVKLGIAKLLKAGGGPSGDKDTVTITALDNSTPPMPFPMTGATITASSSDITTETIDTPVGETYVEHFIKPGTVTVSITASFPDGTVLDETDTVTITGQVGSLVITHSLPVIGP